MNFPVKGTPDVAPLDVHKDLQGGNPPPVPVSDTHATPSPSPEPRCNVTSAKYSATAKVLTTDVTVVAAKTGELRETKVSSTCTMDQPRRK